MKISLIMMSVFFLFAGCASKEPDYVLPTARISDYESDMSGFNTKSYFYDNGHEVVVFDTQFTPELAEKAIEYIKTQTDHPIKFVVITSPNPDKFNGIEVFQKIGAKVIASSATNSSLGEVQAYKKNYFVKMAKMFTNENYPKLNRPDITFDKTYSIKLSHGETVELSELSKSGVSSNQTVAFIPRIKALVVGDLVAYKAHAWLEGGIYQGLAVPKIKNWVADLNELKDLYGDKDVTVYGGRGLSGKLDEVVHSQIDYLEKVDALVYDYVKDLSARGRKKKDLTDPAVAPKHYAEIKNRVEALFPGYKFSYLVQYGVYGLVNSK
jgi:glyoxylase-like metal-dependent hydrolase (beta-lactamase superfamily II)